MSSRSAIRAACVLSALALNASFAGGASVAPLSVEHFRDSATIKDEPIAGVTTVTTEKGYVERHGLLGAVWNDEYLSGTIDRANGRRSFEVVALVTYRGARRSYDSARFSGVNGAVEEPTTLQQTSAVNCPTGECTYTDRLSFRVEEQLLRDVAARGGGTGDPVWHFKLSTHSSGAYSGELSSAEVAGFLAAIDEYTGQAPLAPSVASVRPALRSVKQELGIGGLHVDAEETRPVRSGVLVTAVSRGSVAAAAGVMVGDIVREVDGHAVSTPLDLKTAVAAAAPGTSVEIKVYRGKEELTLPGQP